MSTSNLRARAQMFFEIHSHLCEILEGTAEIFTLVTQKFLYTITHSVNNI